jgi:hypothetical protein
MRISILEDSLTHEREPSQITRGLKCDMCGKLFEESADVKYKYVR